MIKAPRGIECSNVDCDVPFCDGTFLIFWFFKGCMDETVWMGSKLKAEDLQKNAIKLFNTFHPSTHSSHLFSGHNTVHFLRKNPLGHRGSVPLEHIKAYLK